MNVTIETKVCTKCGEDKPFSEYGKKKTRKDGLQVSCKLCRNNEQKARYEVLSKAPEHTCETSGCDQLSKVCTGCGEDKPLTDFYKDKTKKDGHRNGCKVCRKAAQKAYREANREEILAWHKAYHAEKWANDPEYRAQYAANATRRKRLLKNAKQEPYIREDIFERDNWTCQLCQEPIDPELRHPDSGFASIDHIIPISLGGDDTPANVQAAHFGCNSAKGNRVELEDLQSA